MAFTDTLDLDRLVHCLQCGTAIFDYKTPHGKHVALENTPGHYVIIDNTAYESDHPRAGYRGHWDHCKMAASVASEVDLDDFLWR